MTVALRINVGNMTMKEAEAFAKDITKKANGIHDDFFVEVTKKHGETVATISSALFDGLMLITTLGSLLEASGIEPVASELIKDMVLDNSSSLVSEYAHAIGTTKPQVALCASLAFDLKMTLTELVEEYEKADPTATKH